MALPSPASRLVAALALTLACLLTTALGLPAPQQDPRVQQSDLPVLQQPAQTPWVMDWRHWRCRSPFLIEFSGDDGATWAASSVCLEGTCCSALAEGPWCSKEICALVAQESDKPAGYVPLGAGSPKRPGVDLRGGMGGN